ncbi:MAG TPA: FtsX-like permease family protein [Thermoanaerobaculia bacterium]|nr:FtsX-like permease family protein [Thermoanaerobaculia bacterium]
MVLGVAALVVSLALLSGFQTHVLTRLAEEAPHVLVVPAGRPDFAAAEGAAARLAGLPGVVSVTPVVRGRGWITVRGQAIPAVLAGREGAEGIRLDPAQARQLSVLPGEDVTIVSSRTRLSPLGPVPVTVTLGVKEVGSTATGRRQPEAVLPAETARRLFGLPEGGATGFELRLGDPGTAPDVALRARETLGTTSTATTTWQEANRALLLALRLERIAIFATVFLVVVVAGLNLAATSAVLAATRRGDAAVLTVLGASPRVLSRVFLLVGLLLGAVGTLTGLLLGAGLAVVLDTTHAIPLPAELFALAHVPFKPAARDLLSVAAFSLAWSFLSSLVPARMAARVDVTEALRAG